MDRGTTDVATNRSALVIGYPASRFGSPSEEMGEQEVIDALTNWMASVNESAWHLIEQEGGSPLALCHHRVRGPVRRLISAVPPETGDGRRICHNCQNQAVELRRLYEETTKRKESLAVALARAEENIIAWPENDPDEQKEVPGSSYLPGTGIELTAAA